MTVLFVLCVGNQRDLEVQARSARGCESAGGRGSEAVEERGGGDRRYHGNRRHLQSAEISLAHDTSRHRIASSDLRMFYTTHQPRTLTPHRCCFCIASLTVQPSLRLSPHFTSPRLASPRSVVCCIHFATSQPTLLLPSIYSLPRCRETLLCTRKCNDFNLSRLPVHRESPAATSSASSCACTHPPSATPNRCASSFCIRLLVRVGSQNAGCRFPFLLLDLILFAEYHSHAFAWTIHGLSRTRFACIATSRASEKPEIFERRIC